MTVWRSHIWYEHGVLQAAILVGWQIPHGPHEGCVLVYFPATPRRSRVSYPAVDGTATGCRPSSRRPRRCDGSPSVRTSRRHRSRR